MIDTATGTAAAILRVARNGDQEAWAWLVERHGARMLAVAEAITGERALAEDAVQEALISIRRGAGRFRPGGEDAERSAAGWIAHAACFAALHLARERRRRQERERRHALETRPSAAADAPDPESLARLRRGLAELPARHREPLTLHFIAGLGYEDLACRLGITVNAARVRVHRALERLRRALGLAADEGSLGALLLSLPQPPTPPDAMLAGGWKAIGSTPFAPAVKTLGLGIAKGAVVAMAFAAAVAAIAWDPPQPPPDTVEAERARDEQAYREEYLPAKAALERSSKGRWVVIVGGHALHEAAAVATYVMINAAVVASDRAAPGARHRFIFRVGDDGDLSQDLGGTGERLVIGAGLLSSFAGTTWNSATGEFQLAAAGADIRNPKDLHRVGPETALGGFIEAWVDDRSMKTGTEELFQASSGFTGTAVLPPSLAHDLALERWEIPGVVHLTGELQQDEARRAHLLIQIQPVNFATSLQVAVWSQEGHRARRVRVDASEGGHEDPGLAIAERAQDLAAYARDYLPEKPRLEREAAGRWIVIAGGAVARDGAAIASFANAAEADRAAPRAAHRFVFQVGDDGDRVQHLGMCGQRCVVGSQLLAQLPGLATYAREGVFATGKDGQAVRIGPPALDSAVMALGCGDPVSARTTVEHAWPSSVYDGGMLLPPSLAADLRLERWEVPGTVTIGKSMQSGVCRRANLSTSIAAIGFNGMCPAAIWPEEGAPARDIERH